MYLSKKMINSFRSAYICEQKFSILKFRKNKYCSRLNDGNINELAGKIQPQK
jgi:hypothetical protein